MYMNKNCGEDGRKDFQKRHFEAKSEHLFKKLLRLAM